MKKPYVPKRVLSVQLPIEVYDKIDKLAEEWNYTKTDALIRIIKEANGNAEEN